MNGIAKLAAGVGAGAAAMYLLDPQRGRTRRAMLTQKLQRLGRVKAESYQAAGRDAKNRLVGMWHEAASRFQKDDVSDEALQARVRAAMGRCVEHPGAIQVECEDGNITLSGDILAAEAPALLSGAKRVKGVKDVFDELAIHDSPASIPSLQGTGHMANMNETRKLAPGPAMAAGVVGLGLLAYGFTNRSTLGKAIALAGAGLAAKGMLDLEGKRMLEALE